MNWPLLFAGRYFEILWRFSSILASDTLSQSTVTRLTYLLTV